MKVEYYLLSCNRQPNASSELLRHRGIKLFDGSYSRNVMRPLKMLSFFTDMPDWVRYLFGEFAFLLLFKAHAIERHGL